MRPMGESRFLFDCQEDKYSATSVTSSNNQMYARSEQLKPSTQLEIALPLLG